MKHFLLIVSLCFVSIYSQAQFSPLQKILDKHIVETRLPQGGMDTAFQYSEAHKDQETIQLIKEQKEILKKFDILALKDKNTANAFWINAYNFFMISTIIDQGFKNNKLNINSVKDFGTFFNPYKIFKEKLHTIGQAKFSLDEIEKGTLLGEDFRSKKWKDARIHFAVNCASVGCPPLIKEVYTAENIDQKLDQNIEMALKNPRHLKATGPTLHLTHLFKWYQKDFEEAQGSVTEFIKKYIKDPALMAQVEAHKSIEYIDYNWKLNKKENF